MKKNYWLLFLVMVLMAAGLRFYQLGRVPAGMTWDEAAIGYNGFAIWETRRDEWLQRMPVSFQSFGDYKAPLAIYLNGFFTLLFGMNLWAVRFPFALAGVMAVAGFGLLVKELTTVFNTKNHFFSPQTLSLLAMGLLTFSPWHLHFSRIGFESGLALTEIIWATYFLLVYFNTTITAKWLKKSTLLLSVTGFALSLYTYHSAKIVTPLLVLTLLFLFRERVKKNLQLLLGSAFLGVVMLLPLIKDSLFAAGAERFEQASLFGMGLPLPTLINQVLQNFLIHFSPQFLLFGQTETLRHGSGAWSVLLPTTFVLVILGLVVKIVDQSQTKKLFWLASLWLVIGIIPAAIGRDVPHSNRALLALPGFLLLALQGFDWLLVQIQASQVNRRVKGNHDETNIVVKSVLGYAILAHLLFFSVYTRHYYTVFASQSTADFQAGYLEMLNQVVALEKSDETLIEKIRISDEYGQPYIYTLFVRQTNPIWYQGGALIKYEFGDVEIGDLLRKNAIIVGSARDKNDLPFERADQLIYGPDGSVRFAIFITKQE